MTTISFPLHQIPQVRTAQPPPVQTRQSRGISQLFKRRPPAESTGDPHISTPFNVTHAASLTYAYHQRQRERASNHKRPLTAEISLAARRRGCEGAPPPLPELPARHYVQLNYCHARVDSAVVCSVSPSDTPVVSPVSATRMRARSPPPVRFNRLDVNSMKSPPKSAMAEFKFPIRQISPPAVESDDDDEAHDDQDVDVFGSLLDAYTSILTPSDDDLSQPTPNPARSKSIISDFTPSYTPVPSDTDLHEFATLRAAQQQIIQATPQKNPFRDDIRMAAARIHARRRQGDLAP